MSSWWNSSRAIYGAELRAGALCLVDHGWPVVPGSCLDTVPAVEEGVAAASCDPARVGQWWSEAPYSVLLATGDALDVIEVPAWMGRRMASTLREVGLVAPLAATPTGRWWFPVSPGGGQLTEQVAAADAKWHGKGSWVIAPPSECADGLVHWRVHPSVCGWRLPDSELVHSAAAEAARWRAATTPAAAAAPEGADDRLVAQRPAGVASGMRS